MIVVRARNITIIPLSSVESWYVCWLVGFMVFNANFNNISVISWRSDLLVEETGGPGENHVVTFVQFV